MNLRWLFILSVQWTFFSVLSVASEPVDLFDATAIVGTSSELAENVSAKRVPIESPPWSNSPTTEAVADAYDIVSDQAHEQAWAVQTVHQGRGTIAVGDVLLVSIWVRVVDAPERTARFTCSLSNDEQSENLMFQRVQIDSAAWQQLHFSCVASNSTEAPRLAIHAATQKQHMQIGPVRLRNYGSDYPLSDLPQNNITYPGRETDAPWRAAAAERIIKHRTSTLGIIVNDSDGVAVTDAKVEVSLRRHEFGFGSAVSSMLIGLDVDRYPVATWARGPWSRDDAAKYRDIVDRYFRRVTFEAALRPHLWPRLQNPTAAGESSWIPTMSEAVDGSFDYFRERGIDVRGHYLSWGAVKHPPQDKFADSPEQHRDYQMNVLKTLPKQVGSRVIEWDAINHPCGWGTTMEELHGGLSLHVDIMKEARRQSPDGVKLYVNEGQVISERSQLPSYQRIVQHLIDNNAAPDGIGMMGHFSETSLTGMDQAYEIFERLGKLASQLQITELDISVGGNEQLHADYLRDFMTIAFSHPQMAGIVMWGFWEDCHWKPEAALWRKDWSIKPAGEAFVKLLTETWHTDAAQTTSSEGKVAFDNAFFGDYAVKVTHEGRATEYTVRHTRGAATTILSLDEAARETPLDDSMIAAAQPAVVTFSPMKAEMRKHWPKNRLVRMVFHGHSVPAGYFNTPTVRRYDSYPTLFHQQVCQAYPTATIDLAVTAIGGEQSESGAARLDQDVLSLRPDVVFIDYAMNDRGIGLPRAKVAWQSMIEACLTRGIPVVLLTSTPTSQEDIRSDQANLALHANQARRLGEKYNIPVIDSYAEFRQLVEAGASTKDFLSHPVHPNRAGHQVVADLLFEQFQLLE